MRYNNCAKASLLVVAVLAAFSISMVYYHRLHSVRVETSALVQQAEEAAVALDFVKFTHLLKQAAELSPRDPRMARLWADKAQEVAEAGRQFRAQAVTSMYDSKLEEAALALEKAELLLVPEELSFFRERLAAWQAVADIVGPFPDYVLYPFVHQILEGYVERTLGARDVKPIDWRWSVRPHEYQNEWYWVLRVEYETTGRHGEAVRKNEVAYIRHREIVLMRDWGTGEIVYRRSAAGPAPGVRPLTHDLVYLIARSTAVNNWHWTGTLMESGETAEYKGYMYHRVADVRFPTYADFEEYIRSTFVAERAEEYLKLGRYVSINGRLFVSPGEMGSAYRMDLYRLVVLESREDFVRVELHIPSVWDNLDRVSVIEFIREGDSWLIHATVNSHRVGNRKGQAGDAGDVAPRRTSKSKHGSVSKTLSPQPYVNHTKVERSKAQGDFLSAEFTIDLVGVALEAYAGSLVYLALVFPEENIC